MSDFDPNVDPVTQEQADAYVNWSAENFMRLSQGPKRTYRTAIRCAHWLLVVSVAQLHLDDEVETDRQALLDSLAQYQGLARVLERQQDSVPVERRIILRASLDCWEPVGIWAPQLLSAAKNAVSAQLLMDVYPLVDLWDLTCPDVWTLLDEGREQLAMINTAEELGFTDYAVRPSEHVTALFTWQVANNISRRMGGFPKLSPN